MPIGALGVQPLGHSPNPFRVTLKGNPKGLRVRGGLVIAWGLYGFPEKFIRFAP